MNESNPTATEPQHQTGFQRIRRVLLQAINGDEQNFTTGSIDRAIVLLEEALNMVLRSHDRAPERMPVILVKDIEPQHRQQGRYLMNKNYVEFEIQPNMVLPLPFQDFDDYLAMKEEGISCENGYLDRQAA